MPVSSCKDGAWSAGAQSAERYRVMAGPNTGKPTLTGDSLRLCSSLIWRGSGKKVIHGRGLEGAHNPGRG